MKLIHNMILGNIVASLAEGMALAEKVGIDLEDFAEVLSLGSLACRTVNHKSQGLFSQGFTYHLFENEHKKVKAGFLIVLQDCCNLNNLRLNFSITKFSLFILTIFYHLITVYNFCL